MLRQAARCRGLLIHRSPEQPSGKGEHRMPLYMAQFAYTPQAWAALIHTPQNRAGASDTLLRHFGGHLIGLYYTPGAEYDGFALFEAPDDAAAAAVEIADMAVGHLRG